MSLVVEQAKPAGHSVQFEEPVVSENVPDEQFVHSLEPSAFENEPAAHRVQLAAPETENEPAAHIVQLAAPDFAK